MDWEHHFSRNLEIGSVCIGEGKTYPDRGRQAEGIPTQLPPARISTKRFFFDQKFETQAQDIRIIDDELR
tara:strand:- start:33 stop:242 length:210 start_codon:yes stop_codon:yes gene_type:complete